MSNNVQQQIAAVNATTAKIKRDIARLDKLIERTKQLPAKAATD